MPKGGYLFAAGGTGGHLYPAVAVAEALRAVDPQAEILMASARREGPHRELEDRILSPFDWESLTIDAGTAADLRRRPVRFLWRLWRSVRHCRQILRERAPRIVIGCGGYASVPMVLAATREEVPIVLLEQNLIPGRATRRLASRADVVCLSFEESRQRLKPAVQTVVTGNPIRRQVVQWSRSPDDHPPPSHSPPLLLILGGSLGSDAINRDVLAGLERHPDRWRDWRIVHQTGPQNDQELRSRYQALGLTARVEPFLPDLADQLPLATIVVTRAGATTLAELACVGSAVVVVPWEGAADDHQTANAHWYSDHAAALVARTSGPMGSAASVPFLWDAVERLADSPYLRQQLSEQILQLARPNAAAAVVRVIESLLAERERPS